MTELPKELTEMQNLAHLALQGNRIRLTPASVEQLGRLKKLEVLELAGNPLSLPPDFSDMPLLKTVNLSRTGLEQWPKGLRDQLNLEKVNLSYNALSTIPREHLDPAPEHFANVIRINHTIDLRNNAFVPQTSLDLDNYWQRVSQSHSGLMHLRDSNNFAFETLDISDVQTVFPDYTLGRARAYFLSLGDGAAAEISRLKAELQTLSQQLNAWAATGGVGRRTEARVGAILRQRYIRVNEALWITMEAVLDSPPKGESSNVGESSRAPSWRQTIRRSARSLTSVTCICKACRLWTGTSVMSAPSSSRTCN